MVSLQQNKKRPYFSLLAPKKSNKRKGTLHRDPAGGGIALAA
jgi:hypothetical protein